MRSLVFAAIAIAGMACGIQPSEAAPNPGTPPPRIGDLAPDFTLTDQSGKKVPLSAARGQKVVLVFYRGHW